MTDSITLPHLARVPAVVAHPDDEVESAVTASRADDLILTVDRSAQLAAVECHPGQAAPGSVLWRRLDLQGDSEHPRWLDRA